MSRRTELHHLTKLGFVAGALSLIAALALVLLGNVGSANAGSLPPLISAVDCSQPWGGNYLATIDGQVGGTGTAATVTLDAGCTSTPYYLAVYTASDNLWGGGVYPNSYESFPLNQDYPEYIYPQQLTATLTATAVTFTSSPSAPMLTATVDLPQSCWELDVFSSAQGTPTIPSELTAVDNLGSPPLVWAEVGPFNLTSTGATATSTCSPPPPTTTTTTTAPTTTTTAPTTTTT
ncbi:MAG: hypothetical protein ACRDZX_14355, partial [Acidimicrobiales bacterium]